MAELDVAGADTLGKANLAIAFLTVLAPSERYAQSRQNRHKRLTHWARQMLRQVSRWLPSRAIVLVADSSFAVFELLWALTQMPHPVHVVTRLRLDAQFYRPAPPPKATADGQTSQGGQTATWTQIGVETQRQWSHLAIARTTPALPALFSVVTLLAHQQQKRHPFSLPTTAWY